MGYKTEFGQNWQPLTASTVGMALGLSLSFYVGSLFAPAMMAEFAWSKAQFALIGSTPFITMLFMPFAGRFIDRAGPRTAAAVGFICLPLADLAISFMTGDFLVFYAITIVKAVFGVLTTTMVFARVIVERFDRARGFALSIVMSGPPVVGALIIPIIAEIVSLYGWRIGFRALALIAILGGVVTMLLLRGSSGPSTGERKIAMASRADIAALFRSPLFLLITGGMFLVNIPQVVAGSQLKLVLMESSAPGALATGIISLYAAGVAVGRFISGIALDKMEANKVALVALGLPAIGLVLMASPLNTPWVLGGSVLLMALAQGAEGDIGAYLISRKFAIRNYSLILSFMTAALTLGAAAGSLILSSTLVLTDRYATFLLISAGATLIGAAMFYLTGRHPAASDAQAIGLEPEFA